MRSCAFLLIIVLTKKEYATVVELTNVERDQLRIWKDSLCQTHIPDMQQPPAAEDTAAPPPHGGIRFGADASNAYAGEVGYDVPAAEYDTELVDEEEDDVDDNDDGGMQGGSHPSTLQRQMVSSLEHVLSIRTKLYIKNVRI
jgi:hypothetical protein